MEHKADFADVSSNLVYVKAVPVSDLPDEVQKEAGDLDELFALHDSHGEQLALVAKRSLAIMLARQHDMVPLTVH